MIGPSTLTPVPEPTIRTGTIRATRPTRTTRGTAIAP